MIQKDLDRKAFNEIKKRYGWSLDLLVYKNRVEPMWNGDKTIKVQCVGSPMLARELEMLRCKENNENAFLCLIG